MIQGRENYLRMLQVCSWEMKEGFKARRTLGGGKYDWPSSILAGATCGVSQSKAMQSGTALQGSKPSGLHSTHGIMAFQVFVQIIKRKKTFKLLREKPLSLCKSSDMV